MTIPPFTLDGILPPFIGDSPAGSANDMSPYVTTALEVIDRFSTSTNRCEILSDWLSHRADLRNVGVVGGFQWLDGSFVEEKEPRDLDLVTFLYRPHGFEEINSWAAWLSQHQHLLIREEVEKQYKLDLFAVDLHGHPETTVAMSSYLLGLFSHKRSTNQWKGMLKIRLEEDDAPALDLLSARAAAVEGEQ